MEAGDGTLGRKEAAEVERAGYPGPREGLLPLPPSFQLRQLPT